MALLLSLKYQRRLGESFTTVIECQSGFQVLKASNNCHRLAERLSSCVSRERELFSQAGRNDVTLVILDRRDDVITVSCLKRQELIVF